MTYLPNATGIDSSMTGERREKGLIDSIKPYSTLLELGKGEMLKFEMDAAPCLYYIQDGAMDVSYSMDGAKIIVALLGPNEFFGEIGFFDGIARVRNISAIERTVIHVFSKDIVDRMGEKDPELFGRFMAFIAKSICNKFRRVLKEREPIQAYAASLSVEPNQFVESRPLPLDFFNTAEGRKTSQLVEQLKAALFNISHSLQKEPSKDKKQAVRSEFFTAMNSFFDRLGDFNTTLEGAELEEEVWGYLFKETFPYFMRSALIERAYFKPNGYAGDFKMIDMIYRNRPTGDGRFGELVDEWLLNRLPCCAVRSRRQFLAGLLAKESQRILALKDRVHIMNLACGPSRELFDFIAASGQDDNVTATCLDIDPEALKFTSELAASFEHGAEIRIMEDDLIKWALGSSSQYREKQDIIYSAGLFDYLNEELFIMLVNRCYETLNTGGTLTVGNFRANPDKVFMDRLLDWRLIYREKEDLKQIFAKTAFGQRVIVEVEQDAGIQLFAIATKD